MSNIIVTPSRVTLRGYTEAFRSYVVGAALSCIHEPQERFPRRFITATANAKPGIDDATDVTDRVKHGSYNQMYSWDAAFFTQAQKFFGERGLAHNLVTNYLAWQEPGGYIPRTVSPSIKWDGADMATPIFAQALLHERNSGCIGDEPITEEMLLGLQRYYDFIEEHRSHPAGGGLYHWLNVLESGVDNNLALLYPIDAARQENDPRIIFDFPDGRILAIDLNTYLVVEFRAFAELARSMGRNDLGQVYEDKAAVLLALIEEKFWDEEQGSYFNFEPLAGKYVPVLSWTNLTPILYGIASPERAKRVIDNLILNPKHFMRGAGLSSISYSDGFYANAKRGMYGRANIVNWQGPCWIQPNVLAVRGLRHYGYEEDAIQLAVKVIHTMMHSYGMYGSMFENYHAETGEPLSAPHFVSWNVLCLELIEMLK